MCCATCSTHAFGEKSDRGRKVSGEQEWVRAALPADDDHLVAISLANYRRNFAPLLPECDWKSYDDAFFRSRFEANREAILVIADAQKPLGFAKMTGAHIDMFFIDPGVQGAGLGARLLAALERKGAASLECFGRNAGARRFYERQGWRLAAQYRRAFAGADCDFCRYEKP